MKTSKSKQSIEKIEILYFWIYDYKNIHLQEFNLSPRYNFSFKPTEYKTSDNKKKVASGILDCINIKEDNKYCPFIKDFFGSNITNVTAIVGKNGTGKSNLLEFIRDILVSSFVYESDLSKKNFEYCFFFILEKSNNKNSKLEVISNDININTKGISNINIQSIPLRISKEQAEEYNYYTIFYSYLLDRSESNEIYSNIIRNISTNWTTTYLMDTILGNPLLILYSKIDWACKA